MTITRTNKGVRYLRKQVDKKEQGKQNFKYREECMQVSHVGKDHGGLKEVIQYNIVHEGEYYVKQGRRHIGQVMYSFASDGKKI